MPYWQIVVEGLVNFPVSIIQSKNNTSTRVATTLILVPSTVKLISNTSDSRWLSVARRSLQGSGEVRNASEECQRSAVKQR